MRKNLFEQKTLIIISFLFVNIIIMSTNIVVKNKQTLLEYSIGSIISPIQVIIANSIEFVKSKLDNYFFSKHVFQKYIKKKNEVFNLKTKNYVLNLKIEYLKRQMGIINIKSEQFKVISQAKVVFIDKNFLYSSIIINPGSLKKIKKNMLVINNNLELIGNITDSITPLTAKVRLITSKEGGIGAHIQNEDMEGFLTGNNSKICYFNYLIESKPIKIGDMVLTSGTDGVFPEKIPIGKVVNIKKGYLLQEIEVEPFYIKHPMNNLIIIEKIK